MLNALPKMARSAVHPALAEVFDAQIEKTKDHVERLLDISDQLGCRCHMRGGKGMEPMLDSAWSLISDASDELVRDTRLLRAAQSAAHYEMAAYQTAWTTAVSLQMRGIATMLHKTLVEERAAGQKLRTLAQNVILPRRPRHKSSLTLPPNTLRTLTQKRPAGIVYGGALHALA